MTEVEYGALAAIQGMITRVARGEALFPATEVFNEGWLLRLLMDSHHQGLGGLPIPLVEASRWFSEAEMVSAFRPRFRGDPLSESATKADGLVGTFSIRDGTSAGPHLPRDATQVVVIEAKMGSRLSPGTTRVPWYNQAARNFGVLAELVYQSGVPVEQLETVGLVVVAPQVRLEAEPTFQHFMDRDALLEAIEQRIHLYVDRADDHDSLAAWLTGTVRPLWERALIGYWSWESLISSTSDQVRSGLMEYYIRSCELNRLPPPGALL